jgi:hypothetical protein
MIVQHSLQVLQGWVVIDYFFASFFGLRVFFHCALPLRLKSLRFDNNSTP